jgi:hypothetical protein
VVMMNVVVLASTYTAQHTSNASSFTHQRQNTAFELVEQLTLSASHIADTG